MAEANLGHGEPAERIAARELLSRSEAALTRVAETLDVPYAQLPYILPGTHEKRDEATGELQERDLTDEERQTLIDNAKEFGFAREEDVKPSEVGLRPGYVAFIEGGQSHKVVAEIVAAMDPEAMPSAIIIGGCERPIKDDTEIRMSALICGIKESELAETEYEVANQIAQSLPGIELDEAVLPLGYDIHSDNAVSMESTGQFIRKGRIGNAEVIVMRIDRENYTDAEGKPKYRKQPNSGKVVKIIDDTLTLQGNEHTQVGLGSSGSYALTRALRVMRQSISSNRELKFFAYGVDNVRTVRKAVDPKDDWSAPVKQVPEELAGMYKEAQLLKAELDTELNRS